MTAQELTAALGGRWHNSYGTARCPDSMLFKLSLDTVLEQQRTGRDEPVILVLHMACPRVEYTDRGKSAVVIQS